MSRIISSRAPYLVLRLSYAQYATAKGHSNSSVLGRATFSSSSHMMESNESCADPYTYTSGRWLRRDSLERKSRYIRFDFDALRRKVVKLCLGASAITSYEKKEGGFNRVFVFRTDNAKRVVARIPFSLAGPQRLTTNSEVATIQYLQAQTSIPIPRILDWSDDASNEIGSEYIIMEHASGVPLQQKWSTMNVNEQLKCIQAICQKLSELAGLTFPAYGSLYFANTPLPAASKISLGQGYCMGPHCGAIYWDCNVGQSRYYHKVAPNQGPWRDLLAYSRGLIDTGISRIPQAEPSSDRPRYKGSVETHHKLLECGRAVIDKMVCDPRIQRTAAPVMLHPDLHKRNIFVSEEDPTSISAFIDWQSCSIQPAFWYADEVPDFAQRFPDPSDESETEPKSEACAKAFDIGLQLLAPKLAAPRAVDESLFRPLRYCYRTWEDGAAAFREELIQTSLHWEELGFVQPCPYVLPCPEDLMRHKEDYKLFEAAQELRHTLSDLLNTALDGWVPPEDWETVKLAHREAFDGMLQAVLGNESPDDDEPVKGERELRDIWPFDLKE